MGFGGATVDKRVSEEILSAISPLTMAASLAAIEQRNAAGSDRRQALTRQLQQLDYEASRAFDQYNQADPANRLVAEVLEHRWNEKLEALAKLKTELDAELAPQPQADVAKEPPGAAFVQQVQRLRGALPGALQQLGAVL